MATTAPGSGHSGTKSPPQSSTSSTNVSTKPITVRPAAAGADPEIPMQTVNSETTIGSSSGRGFGSMTSPKSPQAQTSVSVLRGLPLPTLVAVYCCASLSAAAMTAAFKEKRSSSVTIVRQSSAYPPERQTKLKFDPGPPLIRSISTLSDRQRHLGLPVAPPRKIAKDGSKMDFHEDDDEDDLGPPGGSRSRSSSKSKKASQKSSKSCEVM